MMEIGVSNADVRAHVVNIHTRKEEPAIIPNAETVAKRPITEEERGSVCAECRHRWIGPLDPCFDAEILQLQVSRGADNYGIAAAVKNKTLANSPGTEGHVTRGRSVVTVSRIEGISLSGPPA